MECLTVLGVGIGINLCAIYLAKKINDKCNVVIEDIDSPEDGWVIVKKNVGYENLK